MGAATALFFHSDPERETLSRRIAPSGEQFEEQQERWNLLAEYLTKSLRDKSGYSIRTWLQGSYKFATQIRPVRMSDEFDIDLGVYFQWEGKPEDGQHAPKQLKGFVQSSLLAYAETESANVTKVAQPKERCCRIHYESSFHIDIPAYHLDAARDSRSLATETIGWETSDPKALYLWFQKSFDDALRTRVRRQVRYVKTWAALKFLQESERPTSTLLTVLVAEAASALDESPNEDDDTLRDILGRIVARLKENHTVPNPVDQNENLARLTDSKMTAFIDHLEKFLDTANRAAAKDNELSAADVWQEAFEHLFPLPDVGLGLDEIAKSLPVAFATPEIKVTATARNNVNRQFTGTNQIGPIPKDCDIRFDIVNAYALPASSTVFWTVRNVGREAENINDLGHIAAVGLSAQERSAYKGTHYMDCVVKIAGETVAIRRVPVTITGVEMPRRNPVSRPEWANLRGRR
jgi:Adenylyl/Guanylyl and SMODS C-terminal sensor domain